jgi:hypothetical protein
MPELFNPLGQEDESQNENSDNLEINDADNEGEKERQKEIKKVVFQEFSKGLKPLGFKKEGNAKWIRRECGTLEIVYLQRYSLGFEFFVEAGNCREDEIIKGNKADVVDCMARERLDELKNFSDMPQTLAEIEGLTQKIIPEWFQKNQIKTPAEIPFRQPELAVNDLEDQKGYLINFDSGNEFLNSVYCEAIDEFIAEHRFKKLNDDNSTSRKVITTAKRERFKKFLPEIYFRARNIFRAKTYRASK